MPEYHIPPKTVRQLAKTKKLKVNARSLDEIINDLIIGGFTKEINHLEREFRFAGEVSALTICKPDLPLPDLSNTPERFVSRLISRGIILENLVGTIWNPPLQRAIQICGLIQDGDDVFIRMVEEKPNIRQSGYQSIRGSYAHFTSAVVHFADGVVELRCAYTYRKDYLKYIKNILGYADDSQCEWKYLTSITKEQARRISELLQAQLTSTQISIPSSVGSLRLNADDGVDLRNDPVFFDIINTINTNLRLPTDDIMDETCSFHFEDPITSIGLDIVFEVNISKGGFKFKSAITESVIDLIRDAFIKVYVESLVERQNGEDTEANAAQIEVAVAMSKVDDLCLL